MIDAASAIRPGIWIALICLVLLAALAVVAMRDARRKKHRVAERKEVVEKAMAGVPPASNDEIDVLWGEALKGIETLQTQLKDEIKTLEGRLAAEREEVQTKTEALKTLARQNRIPITLYELYEGMRHFGRKSRDAQKSDLDWHGKIGITQIDVVETVQVQPGHEIYFTLEDQSFLLVGSHHRYSRLSYIELSLFDQSDANLVTVRVRPDQRGAQLIADAVISMKSGPWIQTLLACRAKMDVRQREVSLLAEHRDVQQLKEKFSLDAESSDLT